jgi:UDP-glucose 4-epimerase
LDKLNQRCELVCNLGTGKGYSVKEVIETVKKVSGKNFNVIAADRRPGDAPILTCNATKAKNELGWKVEKPDLEEMVSPPGNGITNTPTATLTDSESVVSS